MNNPYEIGTIGHDIWKELQSGPKTVDYLCGALCINELYVRQAAASMHQAQKLTREGDTYAINPESA